jgi:hypothetical protein
MGNQIRMDGPKLKTLKHPEKIGVQKHIPAKKKKSTEDLVRA